MISRRSILRLIGSGLGASGISGRVDLPTTRRPGPEIPKAARGVVAEVLLARRRYRLGEPIPFAFRIANNTARPIQYRTGSFPSFHLVEVRGHAGPAPLTEAGELERKAFGNGGFRRRRNMFKVLQPGDSSKFGDEGPGGVDLALGLHELFHLFPGPYTVRITYEEPFWPNPYRLTTPPLAFEVI